MLVSIFAIQDNLVGFPRLFTDHSEAVAARGFRNAIIDQLEGRINDSNVSPVDLSLYCFGTFDTEQGIIELFDSPRLVLAGVNVVSKWKLDSANNSVDKEVVNEC